jgi:hypothetical protein
VKHPPADTKRKLTEEEQELVDHAEFHTLPFGVDKADGSEDGGDEEVISVSSSNKAIMIEMICINT